MKRKIFIIIILINIDILYSQSGWLPLNPVTSSTLSCIHFANPDTGILVSYLPSLIFRTTNGGLNWTQIPYNAGNMWLLKVQMVDQNNGWIAGCEPSSQGVNVILKTTNSGLNWFVQYQGTGILRTIFFINSLTGWAAGEKFLKTTNAGLNWLVSTPPGLNTAYNLQFINLLTGWISCLPPNTNTIIKTTDGGNNWFTQLTGVNAVDICFISPDTGFCGFDGGIFKTTNGGTNWNVSYSPGSGLFLSFVNRLTGWAVIQNSQGYRKILRTANAGGNWTDQGYNNTVFLNDIVMYSTALGWAIGHEGVIYRTTNGGEPLGLNHFSSNIPNHYSLNQNYPNPFNPVTKIRFDIPQIDSRFRHVKRHATYSGNDNVTLIIYDILGREVTSLVNEHLQPGTYEIDFDGTNYPSGIYYYRLITGNFTDSKKMILLK